MAQISSYPFVTPQLGDNVLGSNSVDASGVPVIGNPTVNYTLSSIKTVVDQNYIQQLASTSVLVSQTPAVNTVYNIRFGTPESVNLVKNVQLLQGAGTITEGDKIIFNAIGTYNIVLEYTIGQRGSTANHPFLLFRTLQNGATQVGSTIVQKFQNNLITESKSLIIPITTQITAVGTYFNFQIYKDGVNDGSLVQQTNSGAGWADSQSASITISKLI
jgi:hypothetical protein